MLLSFLETKENREIWLATHLRCSKKESIPVLQEKQKQTNKQVHKKLILTLGYLKKKLPGFSYGNTETCFVANVLTTAGQWVLADSVWDYYNVLQCINKAQHGEGNRGSLRQGIPIWDLSFLSHFIEKTLTMKPKGGHTCPLNSLPFYIVFLNSFGKKQTKIAATWNYTFWEGARRDYSLIF